MTLAPPRAGEPAGAVDVPAVARSRPAGYWRIAAAGAGFAALVGAALASQPLAGVALVAAALFALLVARDLQLAVAVWLPLLFFEAVHTIDYAGKAAGLVILIGWSAARRRQRRQALPRLPPALGVLLAALLAWVTLSMLWAQSRSAVASDLWHWYALAAMFTVVTTTMTDRRGIRLSITGFIVGAAISALSGLAHVGAASAAASASARLAGSAGDPNFLGSWLLAASVFGVVMIAGSRPGWARLAWAGLTALSVIGLVATVSRGDYIAAGFVLVLGLVLMRGRRRRLLAPLAAVLAAASVWIAASPAAAARLTNLGGGSGRYDLWVVAVQVVRDHPLLGVGDNNFTAVEADYLRAHIAHIGPLKDAYEIVNAPEEAHDLYLQLTVEDGLIGLLVYLAFAGVCLRMAVLARRRFERQGDHQAGAQALAVILGQVGMMVAGLFLSNQIDQLFWIMFALGPACLAASAQPWSAPARGPARQVPFRGGRGHEPLAPGARRNR